VPDASWSEPLQAHRLDERGAKVQRARFDSTMWRGACAHRPVAQAAGYYRCRRQDGAQPTDSARETARLMGLDEEYKLPKNYNEPTT